ncbi:flagellin [uncultured Bartonella sp.]|uniref:flagellin n=1 Tax=uncultured Bartonella sp. TaxID=104108 RepID=UPI00260950AE|nr:flagellin [uncultured Bartonella sp.]
MGTSLLTNQSAMNALQTLRAIGNNLDTTQRRVSTGLRINEAADDTAYWSISSMMKSDRNALSAVSSAMDLGKSQIEVAYQSTVKTKEYLDNIEKTLTTVYEKGPGDVEKIQRDVKASVTNIQDAVYSSALAEKNILANGGQTVNIAGAYRREGTAVYVDMIAVGGAELDFASKKTDGTLDLTKGKLGLVFGTDANLDTALKKVIDAQKVYDAAVDKTAGDPSTSGTAPDPDNPDEGTVTTPPTASYQQVFDKALKEFASSVAGITVEDFLKLDFENGYGAQAAIPGTPAVPADPTDPTDTGTPGTAEIPAVAGTKYGSQVMEVLLKALQGNVTKVTSNVVTAGASLGASQKQIENQVDYVSKLMDAIDKGVGALVDADMNAESARLASLQVQQQLGIQALSIANQNSQNILALFRQ